MNVKPKPDTICPMCDRRIRERYRLYDRKGVARGDFCSKLCAEADAWGPIFRPYRIRKIPKRTKT